MIFPSFTPGRRFLHPGSARIFFLATAIILGNCAGSPATIQISQEAVVGAGNLELADAPSYLVGLSAEARTYFYLEGESDERRSATAISVDPEGGVHSIELVKGFRGHLGGVLVDATGALLVPIVRQRTADQMVFEIWRWDGAQAVASQSARCVLPDAVHGQVFARDTLALVYEDRQGDLWLHEFDHGGGCSERERRLVARAPLPQGYLLKDIGSTLVLAGRVGGTYMASLFSWNTLDERRVRFAVGGATEARDLDVTRTADGRLIALFSVLNRGVWDVGMSEVVGQGFSTPTDQIVVASADIVRFPELVERAGCWFASWVVIDDRSGEHLRLISPLDEELLVRGGEVAFRWSRNDLATSTWTSDGLLTAWISPQQPTILNWATYSPVVW
ncbi:MAG: hypothetical protein KC561_01225 [Myxococcales bacterium]|nr:hypothetical protein [Myxococcales bacterium]